MGWKVWLKALDPQDAKVVLKHREEAHRELAKVFESLY
jgi:hypothetical protein